MRFNEALRKVTLDFKQKFLGECLNGEHCPVGVGPGLIPHPLDPAGGLHTGNWLHEVQHRGLGIDPLLHGNIGGVTFGQHHTHYYRYLLTEAFNYGWFSNTAFAVAGRVYLNPISVPFTLTIDRLMYVQGGTIAGNVRMGLYEQGAADLPDGGALVVETISYAQAGLIDSINLLPISETQITPGQYFLAIQGDAVAGTFYARVDPFVGQPGGVTLTRITSYDHAYGPFTDPCPVTVNREVNARAGMRVVSIP